MASCLSSVLSILIVSKCKRELCREYYPNSDPYFQGQTEENELLETIISTDTETSQGQSSEPNWFDFWSKQEIKIIQENEPAIDEMTMPSITCKSSHSP
jgi:hypothetical protein